MIQLDQVSKNFSSKAILDSVSFQFPAQKRIALIGANGAGKTTLLNILCGLEEIDGGKVSIPGQSKIGYLPQEPNPNPKETVLLEAQAGNKKIFQLKQEMDKSLSRLENDHSDEAVKHHESLEAEFRSLDGYSIEAKARTILAGLGFSDNAVAQSPQNLSGGWRMRLELAKIFINDPDFLILDEPTNHLDLPSLVWVENYLKSFKGTLLFVSHDRALLNRLANHTILLIHGQLESYPCAFDKALELRASKMELDDARRENLAKKRQKMEDFVERFGAKATKAKQAQSRVKMIEKLRNLEEGLSNETSSQTVSFSLPTPPKSGREVLRLKELSVGYNNIPLVKGVSLQVERGQKIAVIGANGIGKSTLLKTIVGVIETIDGDVEFGHNVLSAYYSQNHDESLDLSKDCLSNVLDSSDKVGEKDARSLLGAFLFNGDDVFKTTDVLSGGEKARVSLAKILVKNANFLLLDEPTNHLDMASVEALTGAINQFDGTVLFVSHDRTFIDAVCSNVLVILPSGESMLFEGNLDDYQRMALQCGFPNVLDPDQNQEPKQGKTQDKPKPKVSQQEVKELKRARNSQQKALKALEDQEANLKKEKSEIEEKMTSIDPSDYEEMNKLQSRITEIEETIEGCELEWMEVSEKLESTEDQLTKLNRS